MDSQRTTASTPASSPGPFSPVVTSDRQHPYTIAHSDGTPQSSPYLHPLHMHKVRETSKAQVEQDFITGRKLINQYEIITEIGRGVHGKVKLGRNLETGDFVAIKIIQRFNKKRKLGRVMFSPESKTKREIAILKKVRHANVVGLLEVIDDPELKKIYMILEHVELGEIPWRKKGAPQICLYERRRIEKEQTLEQGHDDEKHLRMIHRRRLRSAVQHTQISQLLLEANQNYWNLETRQNEDDVLSTLSRDNPNSFRVFSSYDSFSLAMPDTQISSRASSRAASCVISRTHTPLPNESEISQVESGNVSPENSHPMLFSAHSSSHGSFPHLNELHSSFHTDNQSNRCRSPSMADSIISHISSIDDVPHDTLEEDFSYVPCFTIDQARSIFRDTVLGLEYLHYEGIVHRDIKPANLLWTRDHRVKITDFGVSYFGRPVRDDDNEDGVSEADETDFDDDVELAKTVGTPAFFAPELCCTDLDTERAKITEQIDVWSLGITLYCFIFARIPFMAKDEWQLFRRIAKEEIYIPQRRLKAVNHSNISPNSSIPRTSSSNNSYREENELAFDFVDDELYDLLRRMLMKDPVQRIKLREVKRHPWVLRGLNDIIGWLEDTDPSRVTAGRKIEVDDNELERAVIPITFLERARTVVKKAVGKVIGVKRNDTKVDGSRGSRKPRRRAQSSATSSGADSNLNTSRTPIIKNNRRCSLREEESYFGYFPDVPEHQREGTFEIHSRRKQTFTPQSQYSDSCDPFSSTTKTSPLTKSTSDFNKLAYSIDTNDRPNALERIMGISTWT